MHLLCDAIAFCYGPATVLKQILCNWRPRVQSVTLAGTGTTLEYMRRYSTNRPLVDRILYLDTEDTEALQSQEGSWDVLLSVCNPTGFAALQERARFRVYWDFLLWMRWEGGAPEFQADAYIIEMFPGCESALERWRAEIRNPVLSPILVEWHEAKPTSASGTVLINLGGQRSKLTRPGDNTDYAKQMIAILQEAALLVDHQGPFVVASDSQTAHYLDQQLHAKGWTFASFSHEEFLAQIRAAERFITHPGLYSPFEGFGLERPVYFLPSSNYTQVLQLGDFRRLGLAPRSIDWVDLVGEEVPFGLEEPEGVRRVLALIESINEGSVRQRLIATFAAWLKEDLGMANELAAEQHTLARPFYGDYSAVLDAVAETALANIKAAR